MTRRRGLAILVGMRCLLIAAALLLLVPGCDLYVNNPHPDACNAAPASPSILQRDPDSGQCVGMDQVGTCGGNVPAPPDWAACHGSCDGLDKSSCEAKAGCRAIFVVSSSANGTPGTPVYAACWGTAPSGAIETGDCNGLDAQTCSEHDNCSAIHDRVATYSNQIGAFESCQPEQPVCSTLGEAACIARPDCQPFYQGKDCTCGPSGCTCSSWTFSSCSAGFPCGDQTCTPDQVCEETWIAPGGSTSPSYQCAAKPASCSSSDVFDLCSCLVQAGICANPGCAIDSAGDVTASCSQP